MCQRRIGERPEGDGAAWDRERRAEDAAGARQQGHRPEAEAVRVAESGCA